MQIEDQEFIQYLTIKKRLAPKSIKSYSIRLRVIKRWLLAENIEELTKQSVEKFLYSLKAKELSNAAINTYIQTLNHIEGFFKDRGLPYRFMEGIESLPKTQSEIIILSVEEIEKILDTHLEYKNRNGVLCDNLDNKYLILTSFLAMTGCRFEEAASLKLKRLDIANGKATLVATKNKKNRFIYFDGPIKQYLSELIKNKNPDDLVFTNSKNQHIHPGDFNNDLRLRAKKAGIEKRVHAHLLRHSFATHLLVAGVDVTMVSTLLGHKDLQTTYDTYVHLADSTLQRAALRSPLIRKFVDPYEIIKNIREILDNFHLESDNRFGYSITEKENKLYFEVAIK